MVVNAPTSNIISAAELTVGHILSLARHIPAAHARSSRRQWKRSSYTGTELFEKTVGIIGLGRIGALIAARLQAFDMRVVAYDPYVTSARAQQLGVQLLDARRAARAERLRHDPHAEDARDDRHDRRRAVPAHEADELRRQRRPRRPHRRGGAVHGAHRRARSPAPASTSSRASRPPPTARLHAARPAERHRHAAPRRVAPTRRRRRRASRSPARCGSRSAASSCPTP